MSKPKQTILASLPDTTAEYIKNRVHQISTVLAGIPDRSKVAEAIKNVMKVF